MKILGWYQIVGGIGGLAILALLILRLIDISLGLLPMLTIAFVLFSYSIIAGVTLLKDKSAAITYTLINQWLQLISFSLVGWAFKYVSGIVLSIGIDATQDFKFAFSAGFSTFQITFDGNSDIFVFQLNLVALGVIIFLDQVSLDMKKERFHSQF